MAKKQLNNINLPSGTKVEVIRLNKGKTEIIKKIMLYSEWLELKKQAGYEYHAYQVSYSQFKLTK